MSTPRVAMITLGCARNEVDSEELAARLATAGFELVDDAEDADAVVVNTCGFVEAAKKDSIDTILAASQLGDDDGDDSGPVVVAVGCLAERYGNELAEALPEADAVLGFDDYPDMAERLRAVMAGETLAAHQPRDRRALLPITPVDRAEATDVSVPGHAGERIRLTTGPVANVKLASGCDRRCSFCAIPSFRGSFVSRRPADVLADVRALVRDGVHEVHLVSENSTSYGKDLGDLRLLETLLPECARLVDRVRVAYLQPAEMRPGLIQVIADTAGVAPYFDLSYQHASGPVLKRMRRFGDAESFLGLLNAIRAITPEAGVRSNFIVGFPGETDDDFQVLVDFLTEARLDAIGVFAYSDEDGTEAAGFTDKVPADVIAERYATLTDLVEQLVAERAEERIGTIVDVLIETVDDGFGPTGEGRAAHQGPDDGSTLVRSTRMLAVGQIVPARVVATDGVDLIAETL